MSKRGMCRAAAGAIALSAAIAAPAQGDAVTDWNKHASDVLIGLAGQGPTVSAVNLAMVQGAVYDAVNSIDGGHQPYLVDVPADGDESTAAAAATAAYRVLVTIVPGQQAALDQRYAGAIGAIPPSTARDEGIDVGEAAADAMLAARVGDGRLTPFTFAAGTEPGQWRPVLPGFASDPFARLANLRPFLLERGDQFRTPGPNPLGSEEYAEDFAEVKQVGRLTGSTRTADQTEIAKFWYPHPTALWSRIFRTVAAGRVDGDAESARYYAMLDLTVADSLIACWRDKARWSFWRPITAIREAATDGNPATAAEADWLPLLDTPPYPDHPAGHPCLAGAATETLRQFFGTDKVAFSESNGSATIPTITRRFTRFSQAEREVVDARVYSGIHFRTGDRQGAKLGDRVARWSLRHHFGAR